MYSNACFFTPVDDYFAPGREFFKVVGQSPPFQKKLCTFCLLMYRRSELLFKKSGI